MQKHIDIDQKLWEWKEQQSELLKFKQRVNIEAMQYIHSPVRNEAFEQVWVKAISLSLNPSPAPKHKFVN